MEFSLYHRLGIKSWIFLKLALKGRRGATEPNGAKIKYWRCSRGKVSYTPGTKVSTIISDLCY